MPAHGRIPAESSRTRSAPHVMSTHSRHFLHVLQRYATLCMCYEGKALAVTRGRSLCMCAPGGTHSASCACIHPPPPSTTPSPATTSALPPPPHAIPAFDACHAMRGALRSCRGRLRALPNIAGADRPCASKGSNTMVAPSCSRLGQQSTTVDELGAKYTHGAWEWALAGTPSLPAGAPFGEPRPLPRRAEIALFNHHCLLTHCHTFTSNLACAKAPR